jgi:adenosine deaminase
MTVEMLRTDEAVAANGNWNVFDFCNQFLQTAAHLERATLDLCRRMVLEHNVAIVEVRFCPALHTLSGLTADAAVAAVVAGFRAAQACYSVALPGHDLSLPLKGGVIVCALRSHTDEEMQRMADLAVAWHGRGVIGFDVCDLRVSFV